MNLTTSFDSVVKPRIFGRSAILIKKLAASTGLSENQISNRAVDAGIAAVQKQLRGVAKIQSK
jgi:hypothetical protein